MNKVRICRATWLNGRDRNADSEMTNNKNHSCCLGFGMRQLCGPITNELMRGLGEPYTVAEHYLENSRLSSLKQIKNIDLFVSIEKDDDWYDISNSTFANDAIWINDQDPRYITDKERETQLIKLFAENGITLEFYGNYPKLED